MTFSNTPYINLSDNDFLPVGKNNTTEDENFDIVVDNTLYNITDIYNEPTVDIARWVFKDNLRQDSSIKDTESELNYVANNYDFIDGFVENPAFDNTSWSPWFTLDESSAEDLTIGNLKEMGVFEALNRATGYLAKNSFNQPNVDTIMDNWSNRKGL